MSDPPAATDGIEQYRGQSTLVSALAGAVVTVVTSFVPLSPLLGGGVAAYLYGGDRGDGTRVGAISGAVATVPVLLGVVVLVGFFSIATIGISPRAFGASLVFVLFLLVVLAVVLLYTVGLSALGGYLAVVILEDRRGTAGRGTSATATVDTGSVDAGAAGTDDVGANDDAGASSGDDENGDDTGVGAGSDTEADAGEADEDGEADAGGDGEDSEADAGGDGEDSEADAGERDGTA